MDNLKELRSRRDKKGTTISALCLLAVLPLVVCCLLLVIFLQSTSSTDSTSSMVSTLQQMNAASVSFNSIIMKCETYSSYVWWCGFLICIPICSKYEELFSVHGAPTMQKFAFSLAPHVSQVSSAMLSSSNQQVSWYTNNTILKCWVFVKFCLLLVLQQRMKTRILETHKCNLMIDVFQASN